MVRNQLSWYFLNTIILTKRVAVIFIKNSLSIISIYTKNGDKNRNSADLLLGTYIIAMLLPEKDII